MSETITHRAEIEIVRRQIVHVELDSDDVEDAMSGIDSVVEDCESIEALRATATTNEWFRISEEREPSGSTKLLQFHRGESKDEIDAKIQQFIETLTEDGRRPITGFFDDWKDHAPYSKGYDACVKNLLRALADEAGVDVTVS